MPSGIFADYMHLLWTQGNAAAAIQVERLGSRLAKAYDLHIVCGYSLKSFQGGTSSHMFEQICAEHSAVHTGESSLTHPDERFPTSLIAAEQRSWMRCPL